MAMVFRGNFPMCLNKSTLRTLQRIVLTVLKNAKKPLTVTGVACRTGQSFNPHRILDELVTLGYAKQYEPRGLSVLFQESGYVFVSDPDEEVKSES